ncbi:MAG: fasciclin domain-containing protein [Saprospiraceae bacterium]|nr:fasciclin domain-containing protein [Saprospiraceae bacterium]
MKSIKNLSQWLLIFGFVFSIAACSDDDDNMTTEDPQTIATIATETDDLSILVQALVKADLVSVLEGTGPFTVFAPTNAAFGDLLAAKGFASLDDVPTDVLTSILLNHVVNGNFQSSGLSTGYVATNATEASTGNNLSLYINTDNGVTLNGVSNVITADVNASNGVVHIVDAVIDLPTVVTFATADNTFSTLVAALTRSDLTTDFVGVLSGTGPFTVFAPTNDAFGSLLTELNLNALGDIPVATLDAVLKYHVVGGSNVLSTMLSDDMAVETLADAEFTIDLENGAEIVDGQNRRTSIVVTDVQASNGVVHVISNVILP